MELNGHLTNFVQENSAALALLKKSFVVFLSACEGTLFMTKEHVFNQMLGHGCTVHGDERTLGAGRGFMNHACQDLFTSSCGSNQQGRHIGLSDPLSQGQ